MPAMTALSFSAAAHLTRALNTLGAGVARGLKRIAHAVKNRRSASKLVWLDDRMLADIGLTRSDLRDAYAQPLWHDPTDVLARRAAERRLSRKRVAFERSAGKPANVSRQPPADRPACYLM